MFPTFPGVVGGLSFFGVVSKFRGFCPSSAAVLWIEGCICTQIMSPDSDCSGSGLVNASVKLNSVHYCVPQLETVGKTEQHLLVVPSQIVGRKE